MKNNNIKECFVAFVDILGFSAMVQNDQGTGKNLAIIKEAISTATKQLKQRQADLGHPYHFWYDEFKVKSFSDCFCFSIPLEFENGEKDYKQNFVAFYVWLKVFYNQMLKSGFVCRGGINQGWHYIDDDLIFSKALIDAYLLESKQATHPIIMIHPELIDQLIKRGFSHERYFPYMFSHDNSGKSFFNPFNYSIVDEIFYWGYHEEKIEKFIKERAELIDMFSIIIEKRIANLKGKGAVDKWQWLKEYALFTEGKGYEDKFFNGLYVIATT